MLDPIIAFFSRIFEAIGRGIGMIVAWLLWPFMAFGRWYNRRGWLIKAPVILVLLAIVGGYGHYFYATQFWHGFDPDYAESYDFESANVGAGATLPDGTCAPSAIVQVAADLIDVNVNQNNWVPSMFLSKLGFFGMDWKDTPFMDNKAAFQLGVNQVMRRTSVELVDRLGRVRGTSGINQNLQNARTNLAYDEEAWFITLSPPGPQTRTQAKYREARRDLLAFNDELASCEANFDARPDNLLEFLDRITADIGSTSDILRQRMEASNAGWFDPRADDRFWFTYGQLYAYQGILTAARADFEDVFINRNLDQVWLRTEDQLRASLDMTPWIISNGNESSWIMPSHLATMGFYLLRVRSNLVEMRDILAR